VLTSWKAKIRLTCRCRKRERDQHFQDERSGGGGGATTANQGSRLAEGSGVASKYPLHLSELDKEVKKTKAPDSLAGAESDRTCFVGCYVYTVKQRGSLLLDLASVKSMRRESIEKEGIQHRFVHSKKKRKNR
jgi:hypothetical protein